MGWEERNGRRYFYTKRWVNGTCQSEYVGTGPLADLLALEAQRAALERQLWQAEKAEFEAMEEQIKAALSFGRALFTATMLVSGYRTHKREWR